MDKLSGDLEVNLFNLTSDDVSRKTTKYEALSERLMKNNQNFKTAIRRFAQDQYFLPTGDENGFNCLPVDEVIIENKN